MAGDALPIGASGISPQNLYQPIDRTKPASEQLLAPASIRRYEAHQWQYINELDSAFALTTTDVGYGTTSENKSLEVSQEAEENSKKALAKALNALIAHGMLLGINTSLSTSSNWKLKEISPNTVGIAPDGNHYGQNNPIFNYFGDQKTFKVVSEYTTSSANLSITLPTIIGVNSSIQVQNPDGSTTMTLTQNKVYSFRTYFDGITPKIVIENADLPSASETVKGISYISKPILLKYSTSTVLLYSSGTFDFNDGSGNAIINSGSINLATVGLNGMDTGSIPTSGWLYTYAIYNPTTNISGCIASLSTTSPTLPSGFTKKKRIKNGFLRVASSAIQPFSHYENDWISTNQVVIANQSNVINYTNSILPPIPLKADLTSYLSTTQAGQSDQIVWGNIKPWTTGVDALYATTNNLFCTATNGYIYASDGVVRATNAIINGGVNMARITLKAISEL